MSRVTQALLHAAVVSAALLSGCSCTEHTVLLQPTLVIDTGIDGDAPDDVLDGVDIPDPVDGDADTVVPTGTCVDICNKMWPCGFVFVPMPDVCGAYCARMSDEVRACMSAATTDDCDTVFGCLYPADVPEDCNDICVYMETCGMGPMYNCPTWCPWYSDLYLDCATGYMAGDDCIGVERCLLESEWGNYCDTICAQAVGCGIVETDEECLADCEFHGWNLVTRVCIDTAVQFGDCAGLAACGGPGT